MPGALMEFEISFGAFAPPVLAEGRWSVTTREFSYIVDDIV
jgi:hypothetical protein